MCRVAARVGLSARICKKLCAIALCGKKVMHGVTARVAVAALT